MARRGNVPDRSTAGLRWLIHLTSLATAGALLGAATAPQLGWTMPVGAMAGGLTLGGIAILRRWLVPPSA